MNLEQRSMKDILETYRTAISSTDEDLPPYVRLLISFFDEMPIPAIIKGCLGPEGRVTLCRVNKAFIARFGDQYKQLEDELSVLVKAVPLKVDPQDVEIFDGQSQKSLTWSTWTWPISTNGRVLASCGCAVFKE